MDFDTLFKAVQADAATLEKRLDDSSLPRGARPALELDNGKAGCAVHVHVGKDDKDPDGIFGAPSRTVGIRAGAVLHPLEGMAWLKFVLSGNADAKRATGERQARLDLAASGEASVGAYRQVPLASTLATALAADTSIPFILAAADVRSLGMHEACFISLAGKLSAKLKFSWADVLTGPIEGLQALAPSGKPVNFRLDSKAALTVALSVTDSFRLVFTGRDSDFITVALNRSSGDALAVGVQVGAGLRFEKPDLARSLLADLAAQLSGVPQASLDHVIAGLEQLLELYDNAVAEIRGKVDGAVGQLDAALDAHGLPLALTRLGQLQAVLAPASKRYPGLQPMLAGQKRVAATGLMLDQLAEQASARIGNGLDVMLEALGLPALEADATAALQALLERLEKLEQALSSAAKKRIQTGLEFEYRRIAGDACVFRADLRRGHADFDRWHRALLALDLAPLLDVATPGNPDVRLQLLLQHQSIKRSLSLGLDLGGMFVDMEQSGTEWVETIRTQPGLDPTAPARVERRLALQGSRSRRETSFGTAAVCRGQFDADFLAVGSITSPGVWRFALDLSFTSSHRKADARWLRALADYAVLWGVIPESEIAWLVDTLVDDGAIGQRVSMDLGLVLDRDAFADTGFLESFGKLGDSQLADALAMALPLLEDHAERTLPSRRIGCYRRAMPVLLGASGIDMNNLRKVGGFVARHLDDASPALKQFERRWQPATADGSVADTLKRVQVAGPVREFRRASALALLTRGDNAGSPAERQWVADAFHGWDLAWRDRYLLRWQVCLLRELARAADLEQALAPRLKVAIGREARTRLFAPARGPQPA